MLASWDVTEITWALQRSILAVLIRDQWVSVSWGRRNNEPHSSVFTQDSAARENQPAVTQKQRLSSTHTAHMINPHHTQRLWRRSSLFVFLQPTSKTLVYGRHPKWLLCSCQTWVTGAKWPLIFVFTGWLSSPVVNFSLQLHLPPSLLFTHLLYTVS